MLIIKRLNKITGDQTRPNEINGIKRDSTGFNGINGINGINEIQRDSTRFIGINEIHRD
jgi:hypothetical protein